MIKFVFNHLSSRNVFYCSIVAGTAVVLTTALLLKNAYESYHESRAVYSEEIRSAFRTVENYEWLAGNARIYNDLTESGVVGLEDNLDWVDFLAPLGSAISISDYQFEISPFASYVIGENLSLKRADISIFGDVLHDGVIVDLLDYISVNAPGAWFYNSMEVVRSIGTSGRALQGLNSEKSETALTVVLKLAYVVISQGDSVEAET